jgi:hypothetical protein
VQDWIENETEDVPLNARVVCRIYANVRGLADVLVRTGAIERTEVFEDFVRGFTRAKNMFDFIDVGSGKDRADGKIIGKRHKSTMTYLPLMQRQRTSRSSLRIIIVDDSSLAARTTMATHGYWKSILTRPR